MDEQTGSKEKVPGTEGRELPAYFTNRFSILVGPTTTRIAFGEAVVGIDATYHSAIVLTTVDALELANLLSSLIKQSQEILAAKKA